MELKFKQFSLAVPGLKTVEVTQFTHSFFVRFEADGTLERSSVSTVGNTPVFSIKFAKLMDYKLESGAPFEFCREYSR